MIGAVLINFEPADTPKRPKRTVFGFDLDAATSKMAYNK